jgi:hypothetical protein
MDPDEVRKIVHEAIGAASAVFMRKYPDCVMPSDELLEVGQKVLSDSNIYPNQEDE